MGRLASATISTIILEIYQPCAKATRSTTAMAIDLATLPDVLESTVEAMEKQAVLGGKQACTQSGLADIV